MDSIVLSILTSILTGGFVLILVEIGNRRNRSLDIHYQIMRPFMKKLSAYFRFIHWMHTYLHYPESNDMTFCERNFKELIEQMQKFGSEIILSGGDYPVDYFENKTLTDIAKCMNNIWYYYDRMNPRRITFEERIGFCENFIEKELSTINPIYLKQDKDESLIVDVSEDFYLDIYQPIEHELYRNSNCLYCCKAQSFFAVFAVILISVTLTSMLFISMNLVVLKIITAIIVGMFCISVLSLCVNQTRQLRIYHSLSRPIITAKKYIYRKMQKIMTICRIAYKKNKNWHLVEK